MPESRRCGVDRPGPGIASWRRATTPAPSTVAEGCVPRDPFLGIRLAPARARAAAPRASASVLSRIRAHGSQSIRIGGDTLEPDGPADEIGTSPVPDPEVVHLTHATGGLDSPMPLSTGSTAPRRTPTCRRSSHCARGPGGPSTIGRSRRSRAARRALPVAGGRRRQHRCHRKRDQLRPLWALSGTWWWHPTTGDVG